MKEAKVRLVTAALMEITTLTRELLSLQTAILEDSNTQSCERLLRARLKDLNEIFTDLGL